MRIKLMVGSSALALALMMACGGSTNETNTTNATNSTTNTTNTKASVETTPATNTEYTETTATDNGATVVTRTYNNNPRISKVVITTRDGKKTAKVYSTTGEEAELHTDDLDDVLRKSGNDIADAAGFVADKTKTGIEKTAEGAKTVGEKTAEGAKTVGDKTVEGAKTVGEKTAEGAKTVGEKTVNAAKKTGSAIKKAVTP